MNRSTTVKHIRYALYILLGFGLVYALPMLGLNFAVEHGLYVAAGIVGASALRAVPGAFWIDEDGTEHQIDSSRPGAPGWSVVHFIDPSMDVSMVQNRHVIVRQVEDTGDVHNERRLFKGSPEANKDVREPHTLLPASREKVCICGHPDYMHGNLFGCWAVRGDCGLECTCAEFNQI